MFSESLDKRGLLPGSDCAPFCVVRTCASWRPTWATCLKSGRRRGTGWSALRATLSTARCRSTRSWCAPTAAPSTSGRRSRSSSRASCWARRPGRSASPTASRSRPTPRPCTATTAPSCCGACPKQVRFYLGFLFSCLGRKEGNVLFNDALNTFYLRLYGVEHMVKDHSDSERGNLLLPHGLLFPITSKGSFICTIPQT